MSCRRTSNNWPTIIKKKRTFVEAVKRAVEIQDLKTPRRVKAYVIRHKDEVVSLEASTSDIIEVTDQTLDSDSLDGYITIDEYNCNDSECGTK